MRTTVTVDSDVEQLLRDAMRQRGEGFKETLNEALRKGLADTVGAQEEVPFAIHARALDLRAGHDPGRLSALADDLEAQAFIELTDRLTNDSAPPRY